MEQYDIFISCKSEDYEIAEKVYSFLTNNGFSVFLASQELRKIAITAYMDSISKALDSAYSMIVVSTKKEYLESEWVKLEWSTFLCEILSKRKTGQIMTLVENIEVGELPTLLRTYQSFALKNYEDLLPYLEKMKKPEETNESTEEDQLKVNNERAGDAEVHIETDIACRVVRFQKEFVTAQPKTDNLIHLKKGKHKLTFISLENEQDSYSEVCTVKDDCEFLQISLTKIRDARLAKEEAERKIIALEDANRDEYRESGSKIEGYDIFISCKSEDYEIGEKVYSFLKDNGFRVFLSSKELRRMAQADYMDAISVALDTAYSMIVISTKKEYLTSKWVKFEWSTFLNEILSGRKTGQIMTLLENIKVSELPIQLRKYNSFDLENYEAILPYIKKTTKPKEPNEYKNDNKQNVNNAGTDAAEVHIETDIACRVMRFKEELITAVPDDDNLIKLKKGTHKLKFVSIDNEQDNYSQVFTVKDDCEFLQVTLVKIRDARLAKEEEERLAKETERKRLAKEDGKYNYFVNNGKWGFTKDGVVVIPAKYDIALSFSDGLARVKLYGKWGYIDYAGKEVIPVQFSDVCEFNDGLAKVKLKGKWGLIDKEGNFTPDE